MIKRTFDEVRGFVDRRYFLVGVVAAVGLAAVCPEIGRKGGILRPELTVAWGATCGIFLLAGISLPTNQLAAAALQWREHALIQSYNLGFMPLAMLGICSLLTPTGLLEKPLLDGLLVMAALPTTVNMCVALTRSSGGNEPLAIFNAVLGNIFGVVLTPALLVLLVGSSGTIPFLVRRAHDAPPSEALSARAPHSERRLPPVTPLTLRLVTSAHQATLQKLCTKVLAPLLVGQALRRSFGAALSKSPGSKKLISRTSESLLLLTVYSTFCDTFLRGFGARRSMSIA